jgi:hypothetical protein
MILSNGFDPTWTHTQKDAWAAHEGQRLNNKQKALHVAPPAPEYAPAYQSGLVSLTGADLLQREFPARELLLSPWLPSKGLAMVFAERGIGKTWVGLNIAHATAGGGGFLRWRASRPSRVVYIDGEMPAGVLKDRYATHRSQRRL